MECALRNGQLRFDRLPGVMILELSRAEVSEDAHQPWVAVATRLRESGKQLGNTLVEHRSGVAARPVAERTG